MKKSKFFFPEQLVILDSNIVLPGVQSGTEEIDWAKPDPFIDDEEEEIFLPDGGSVITDGEDIVITPDATGGIAADEAYY